MTAGSTNCPNNSYFPRVYNQQISSSPAHSQDPRRFPLRIDGIKTTGDLLFLLPALRQKDGNCHDLKQELIF